MSKLSEKRKAAIEPIMKEAIYQASVQTLLDHGLNGLTMERVAESAGMAKGTLYNYFQDKKCLQVYIFARVSQSFNAETTAIRQSKALPSEKIVKIIEQMFQGFEKHRQILVILAQGRIQNLKEYSAQLSQFPEFEDTCTLETTVQSIIQEGIQAQQFHAYDPRVATDFFLGAATSIIDRQIEDDLPRPSDEQIAQLIRFIMGGLVNTPPTSNVSSPYPGPAPQ